MSPDELRIAPAPAWLIDLADPPRPETKANGHANGAPLDGPRTRNGAYGAAALRGELERVEHHPEGGRNNQLNLSAYSLGRLVPTGAVDEGQAVQALEHAARVAGLSEHEIEGTVRSGLEAGKRNPREIPDHASAIDWATRTVTMTKVNEAPTGGEEQPQGEPRKKSQPSASTVLTALAIRECTEMFHTPDLTPFARVRVDDHLENVPVRSRTYKQWLSRLYWLETGTAPSANAVNEALGVIESRAIFDGAAIEVHVRTALVGDRIYIDMADARHRALEVDADGWRIVNDPPVRFRRAPGMLPLPEPVAGATLDALRAFVNVSDLDWPLITAWLKAATRGKGPYPVLSISGPQGSAKSTTTRVLRSTFDPNAAPIRRAPKDERDLLIAAVNSAVVTIENASSVGEWLSDSLCSLATGGGLSTRALWTDDEERLFEAQRPVMVNGIAEVITRSDLLDRCVLVTCPAIDKTRRQEESVFWARFERAHPRILGALLDTLSLGLRNLPTTKLDELPRMADFARWAAAASTPDEREAFLRRYAENIEDANALALEGSPVAEALLAFAAGRPGPHWAGDVWLSSAGELLAELTNLVRASVGNDRPAQVPAKWPTVPRALSVALRRLAPNLAATGVLVEVDQKEGVRKRLVRVTVAGDPGRPPAAKRAGESPFAAGAGTFASCSPPIGGTQMGLMDAKPSNPPTPHDCSISQRKEGVNGVVDPLRGDAPEFAAFPSFASPVAAGDRVHRLLAGEAIEPVLEVVDFEVDAQGDALAVLSDGSTWPVEDLEPDVEPFDPGDSF